MDAGHWILLIMFLIAVATCAVLTLVVDSQRNIIRSLKTKVEVFQLKIQELETKLKAAKMGNEELADAIKDPNKSGESGSPFRGG